MRVDGKQIASAIFDELKDRVDRLKNKHIIPHVVIILVGDDPASQSYVRQKELKAQEIGAQTTIHNLDSKIQNSELLILIEKLNQNPKVHGIIVQRPLPAHIDSQAVNEAVNSEKDIDAFRSDSPYQMPLAAAVIKILEYIYVQTNAGPQHTTITSAHNQIFSSWLNSQNIVVIGKGETGGGPTITLLKKIGAQPQVIDSKTQNPQSLTKKADIIISTVGKENVIMAENIKKGVILLGVGMHRGTDDKLHPDYNELAIKDIASFYTPVPGGVGPVNVAMLLKNLVDASKTK